MKNLITITLLLLGLYAHSQVTTLPAGSKPLSAQVFIDPDEKLWVGVDGKYYAVEGSGGGGGTGTVTSVGLTAPTGFTVSGSPVTSSGNLTLGFSSGYSLPTTANQSNWSTAYGWGNHASAGYAVLGTAGGQVRTNTQLDTRYIRATEKGTSPGNVVVVQSNSKISPTLYDMPAGIPSGGTPGQLLGKLGSSDYDVTWITPAEGTAYSAGTGLTLSGTQFSLPITYSGTGNYVQAVATNANGITVTRGTLPSAPTYSPSTSITITTGNEIRRAALTGDVTASANSNNLTIANSAVTTSKLASGSVTAEKFASFASGTYPNGAIVAWAPSSSIQTASYHAFQPYFWVDGGNIGISNFTTTRAGLVPPPGSGSNTRALMANGTWAEVGGGGSSFRLRAGTSSYLTGDVSLIGGNNVTLSQSGNNITINSTGGGFNGGTSTTGTTINMSGARYQRLGNRSSNTTLSLSNNVDGAEVQVSLTNTGSSTITVSVSGATLLGSNQVGAGRVAVVSISNFGGGQTLYTLIQ